MSSRLMIAYSLIALIVIFGSLVALWLRHNSRDRLIARRRVVDQAGYDRRKAQRDSSAD